MASAVPARPQVYNPLAKALHWAVAVLIVVQLLIAWRMPDIHKGTLPEGAIAWHLRVGVAIVILVVARALWRIARPPTPGSVDATVLGRVARAGHALLYLLMVVVPALGWANASSRDWAVGLAGVELPRLMAPGAALGHVLGDIHGYLAWTLGVVAALHVLAGLYHQLALHDDTMRRMI
jgi:cytochrome b561